MSGNIEAGYWRDVVGAEYDSLPRLSLTVTQAMRLWSIDEDIARRVLDSYVESSYLTLDSDGRYRRSDVGQTAVVMADSLRGPWHANHEGDSSRSLAARSR